MYLGCPVTNQKSSRNESIARKEKTYCSRMALVSVTLTMLWLLKMRSSLKILVNCAG